MTNIDILKLIKEFIVKMLKYNNTMITFSEIPEEVSLCIEISGCPVHCEGCHSKHLWEDIGDFLTVDALSTLIHQNDGITAVCFMGGDNSPLEIYELAKWVKDNTKLKVGWYSGMPLRKDLPLKYFNYVKTGPYKKELGGLNSITTNQRFYEVRNKYAYQSDEILYRYLEDVTYKFQKR